MRGKRLARGLSSTMIAGVFSPEFGVGGASRHERTQMSQVGLWCKLVKDLVGEISGEMIESLRRAFEGDERLDQVTDSHHP